MPLILDTPPSEREDECHDQIPIDPKEERRRNHHEADVVIIGAGILGSAMATTLARQGRSVILLEKSWRQPNRIVGELLQPGGVAALKKLGLSDCLDDIDAIPVYGYEILYYGEPVMIPYPATKDEENVWQGARPEGRSFHHGRFVQRLREAAMRESNISIVESTAVSLVTSDMDGQVLGVECKTGGQKDYYFAHLTIVSDGHASVFRNHTATTSLRRHDTKREKRTPTSKSKFWGLELYDCPLPSPQHGHVVLGAHAPILLYQIGAHETRILVDVPTNTPTASVTNGGIKGHLRKETLPSLPSSVQPSFDEALRRAENRSSSVAVDGEIGSVGAPLRSMPNSFLPAVTNRTAGLLVLGDALNMRHPLTGGGMTVALNDVQLLSTLLAPDQVPSFSESQLILAALRIFHWRRKKLSAVINILAQALYSFFAADDDELNVLQMGCLRYFERGGECVHGPSGLLAGLTKRPFVLFYHFFSVALFAIWIYILEGMPLRNGKGKLERGNAGLWTLPVRALRAPAIFWKACVVIFPYIWSEVKS